MAKNDGGGQIGSASQPFVNQLNAQDKGNVGMPFKSMGMMVPNAGLAPNVNQGPQANNIPSPQQQMPQFNNYMGGSSQGLMGNQNWQNILAQYLDPNRVRPF